MPTAKKKKAKRPVTFKVQLYDLEKPRRLKVCDRSVWTGSVRTFLRHNAETFDPADAAKVLKLQRGRVMYMHFGAGGSWALRRV